MKWDFIYFPIIIEIKIDLNAHNYWYSYTYIFAKLTITDLIFGTC